MRRLLRLRALAGAAVTAVLATGLLAACGGDDDPQSLTFKADGGSMSGPSSGETGETEITLTNDGKQDAELTLLRTEGDRSAQDVLQSLGGIIEGGPFPDWLFAAGGIGSTTGGESQTVTQVLEPGSYWAVNTAPSRQPTPDAITNLEVTGEATDEELEADAEVEAIDYGFKATGLEAGENEILFTNTGAQPHHILASQPIGDATAADAEKAFKAPPSQSGPPPLRQKGSQSTAVLEGGDSQLVTLDLEQGKYILYCFIQDRQGGPPHAIKGMVDEVEVK